MPFTPPLMHEKPDTANPSPKDIAEWMLYEIQASKEKHPHAKRGFIYQENIANALRAFYGDQFVYKNQNGNLGISKDVLKEFRIISDKKVVWERGDKSWCEILPNEKYTGRQAD